jgi:hypothetical protein
MHEVETRKLAEKWGECFEYWEVNYYCDNCGTSSMTQSQVKANRIAENRAFSRSSCDVAYT